MAPMRTQTSKTFWVDKVILCNSRKPNTDGLGLEAAVSHQGHCGLKGLA